MTDPAVPLVVGLDLSLRATGIADAEGRPCTVKPDGDDYQRMDQIRSAVMDAVPYHVELVMIEAPIAHLKGHSLLRLAALGGVIRQALYDDGVPFLDVQPSTLKIYATGKGNVDKYAVLRAAERRLGYEGLSDDEADALWLRAIGAELLGAPLVQMPEAHIRGLNALKQAVPVRRRT